MIIKLNDVNQYLLLLRTHVRTSTIKNALLERVKDCSQGTIKVLMLLTVGASLEYIQKTTGATYAFLEKVMDDYGMLHGKFPEIYLMMPCLHEDKELMRDVIFMAQAKHHKTFLKDMDQLSRTLESLNRTSFLKKKEEIKQTTLDALEQEEQTAQEKAALEAQLTPREKISKEAQKIVDSYSKDQKSKLIEMITTHGLKCIAK